jgi:DNA helicase-2/ATP-dependent DNA helicase PcrA
MPDFHPTPEQEAILNHNPERHARVLAGPGTGKSATLVALIDKLLATALPPRIKLLTFTRAATGELARKVSAHPAAAAERPSTIHSFAISVLLRNPGAGGFPEPLRIADTWEYKTLVRRTLAIRAGVSVRTLERLVQEMAANWESLHPETDTGVSSEQRARFVGVWNEHRRVYGYTLLNELPFSLRKALLNHPDLQAVNYNLMIVDEYQDLNACDLEVLRFIAARGCSIIAAGDDDQSIYHFRKAAPEGIRRFPQDYPDSDDYPLSVSKRCGKRIISWANYVIQGDPDRPQGRPALTSALESPDGEACLLAFRGERDEASGVATIAQKLIEHEGLLPSDILVLLRSDYNGVFSKPIKERLSELNIPYSDPDAIHDILADQPNRRLLSTLRLVCNRSDSLAWSSLLHCTSGIGAAFIDYIYNRARTAPRSFGEELLSAFTENFPEGPLSASRKARELVNNVLSWLDAHPLPTESPQIKYGQWIMSVAGDEIAPAPTNDLRNLLLALDDVLEPDAALERFLGQIEPLGKDLACAESQGIRIMTMASAKGLTARAAIIAALEDGIMPRENVALSEEHRLLYVAMTRAQEFSFGTWARRRRGPTARAGRPSVATPRTHSHFFDGGPVQSQDGAAYIRARWG